MKNNIEEAKKSLARLRTGPIDKEIVILENSVKAYTANKGGIRDIVKVKSNRRAVTVTMGLMVIQQMTAMSIVTLYLQFIFEIANSSISPDIATIIIGVVQVFGSLASTVAVDKLGRRPLLLASTIFTCLSLISLGT
ncbi:Sugar transporter [Popillia japonica]|uniref:Sugar transporter n=1 Tax=Popillia japonica TaxID=7064 RepID=A0AAW1JIL3_POPJA